MVRRSWRWVAVVVGLAAIVAVACTADDSPSSTVVDDPVSVATDADGPTLDPDILLPPANEEPPPELFPPTPPPGVEGLAAEGAAASNEDSAPLPEWARDAVELSVEQRVPGADERVLVSRSCTQCDVGDVTIGTWVADETGVGVGSVLFSNALGPRISPDGLTLALLGCRSNCSAEGALFEEMPWVHVSVDRGWRWQEVELPPGFWTLAAAHDDGSFVAERWEVVGSRRWEREVAERQRFFLDGSSEPDMDSISEAAGGRLDAQGNRWTARQPDGSWGGSQALFRNDDLVRDYSPSAVGSLKL